MIDYLNTNAGAVTALATILLLLVTGWYAWTTRALLVEAKQSRLLSSEPRVVAYLRTHDTHPYIGQMCITNLSSAAAVQVSASISPITDWPDPFYLHDSKILRDLSYLQPNELLRFDIGLGENLWKNDIPAEFRVKIKYCSIDNRNFLFDDILRVESISGRSRFTIYGLDRISRHLEKISDTLKSFSEHKRLKVDMFSAADRASEYDRVMAERDKDSHGA